VTDDPFVAHRSLLFTVGYEMLGSAADAQDVVQETWLRWADVEQAEVRRPAGLSGPDRHSAGVQPAAGSGAATRAVRRGMASSTTRRNHP
jgi:Sigma-70 region 2